jgi:hypothetical protein
LPIGAGDSNEADKNNTLFTLSFHLPKTPGDKSPGCRKAKPAEAGCERALNLLEQV